MGETSDTWLPNRLNLTSFMATVSGAGALLALSFAVAPLPAQRLEFFVIFSADVLLTGSVVWLCRRVGLNQLLLQVCLACWVLFLLNLVCPMGVPTFPTSFALAPVLTMAATGVVVTSLVIPRVKKAGTPTHVKHLGWWLLARAVFWNLLGAGLLITPLEIAFLILTKNPIE